MRAALGRMKDLWQRTRFEQKLTIAFAIFIGFSILMGLHAFRTASRAHALFERSKLAHNVLYNLGLLARQHSLMLLSMGTSVLDKPSAAELEQVAAAETASIAEIRKIIVATRKAIIDEIAFVGTGPGENEQEELERLQELELLISEHFGKYHTFAVLRLAGRYEEARAAMRDLERGPLTGRIRKLIRDGIEDEHEESQNSDQRAHLLLRRAEQTTALMLVLGSLLAVAMAAALVANVRRPLAALRAGVEAYSRDELEHRIHLDGNDEFAELARSINLMAAEREARRDELIATTQLLERAVERRTQELVDANSKLASVDNARRRFLADISHELRTPLTIIRGESDVGLRGADKTIEEYKSALRRIQEEAGHSALLVDDLLFLARREAGDIRLQVRPVRLAELIDKTCAEVASLAEPKRIRVTFESRFADAMLLADAARIRQLLVICLDNAIRYSLPEGIVTVSLDRSGTDAVIRVADNGIGISDDDLPHVFTRFYRGARAEHHDVQGTGLGLPMAKAIVEAHDGQIEIASRIDEGTTVEITIPGASATKARA